MYAVGPDNKVQVQPVQISLTQGLVTLIASGLQPGERVVTDGQEHLQADVLVDPRAPQPHRKPAGKRDRRTSERNR